MFKSKRLYLEEINEKSLVFGRKKNDKKNRMINAGSILEICDSVHGKNSDTLDLIFKTETENIMVDMTSDWELILGFGKRNNIKIIRKWEFENIESIVLFSPNSTDAQQRV